MKREWLVKKAYLQVYGGSHINKSNHISIDNLEGSLYGYVPDYSNDHLVDIPELVEVEVIVREKKSLGKVKCLNG